VPRSRPTLDRRPTPRPPATAAGRSGRLAASLALAALLALVRPGLGLPGGGIARADGAACGTWTTSFDTPLTIRVYRHATDTVDTVDFRAYVENVMAWEWPASYPAEALKAGAIAVKQYGWYYAMHARTTYVTAGGECYDVRDDTNDQIYDPSLSPKTSQLDAVAETWPVTVRHGGTFFLTSYRSGTLDVCGGELVAGMTRLYQRGVKQCALDGLLWPQILHTYMDQAAAPVAISTITTRTYGATRYQSAVAVSQAAFPDPGVPVVFIATGENWPDALAGGPAAKVLGGPLLLVQPDAIPDVTLAELTRLAPLRIVVLGGPAVVPDDILGQLGAVAPTERWAGDDRYATAVAISAATFADPGVPIVFIATGENYPDAVVGASAGAAMGGPVLLVHADAIPDVVAAELTRLAPAAIRVLGGSGVVSDAVLEALRAFSPDVDRLAGADRYETAAAVSAYAYQPGGSVRLATGLNFPDALAVGPLGLPLLLVPRTDSAVVDAEAVRLAPVSMVAVGGAGALSDEAVGQVVAALTLVYGP
jgi:putative cell wall-binding protein